MSVISHTHAHVHTNIHIASQLIVICREGGRGYEDSRQWLQTEPAWPAECAASQADCEADSLEHQYSGRKKREGEWERGREERRRRKKREGEWERGRKKRRRRKKREWGLWLAATYMYVQVHVHVCLSCVWRCDIAFDWVAMQRNVTWSEG